MSLEDFQLKDDISNDTSIIRRDYMKIYNQQGAQLKNSNQDVILFFGKKIITK